VVLTPEELKIQLLLAIDTSEQTDLHAAAEWYSVEPLQKILQWAKNHLHTQEFKNKLLLATENSKKTAWHVAAMWSKTVSLQIIWKLAKEVLTSEELKNILLLAKYVSHISGKTALHAAAKLTVTEPLTLR